jgi:hypothetical protein
VRPTNPAILHGFRQLARLRLAIPDALVVMIAGNHDTPRSSETGCILSLFRDSIGIHVVDREPQRLAFPEHDLAVLCVPDVPGPKTSLVPDPAYKYNVLLLHGEVQGMMPAHVTMPDRTAVAISKEELGASRWTYVALGHYHVYRQIAPNAYYAGSIDYTSANGWGELYEERLAGIPGKGFIEQDLETGEHTFHSMPPVRPLIDLPPVSARGLTVAEVDERIRSTIEQCEGGVDDKIVRLVVGALARHIARGLGHKALREFKRRALHFHLDTRRPEVVRLQGQASPGRRPSLADVVREKLSSRLLEGDINREELVELGLRYLRAAESAGVGVASLDVGLEGGQ